MTSFVRFWPALACLALLAAGCGPGATAGPAAATPSPAAGGLQLSSPAFAAQATIPRVHTCQGDDTSPPLQWTNLPAGTKSLALVVDDPDGGDWVHWLVYNLPASSTDLMPGLPREPELSGGIRQGKNSWGKSGYGGPCPPSGTHRYIFRLYALDTVLDLEPGAEKSALLQAMNGHVLGQAEMIGLYAKE